jgi:hypothetical protein
MHTFFTKIAKKFLPVKHPWLSSQRNALVSLNSSAKVSQPSVVTAMSCKMYPHLTFWTFHQNYHSHHKNYHSHLCTSMEQKSIDSLSRVFWVCLPLLRHHCFSIGVMMLNLKKCLKSDLKTCCIPHSSVDTKLFAFTYLLFHLYLFTQ